MTTEQIAQVCHEANRAYCLTQGDSSQLPWDDAPRWQKDSAMAGVRALQVDPTLTPKQLHTGWCAVKIAEGWVYGEVKDATAKTHPCLTHYDCLPEAQRRKDYLFQGVVRALAFNLT